MNKIITKTVLLKRKKLLKLLSVKPQKSVKNVEIGGFGKRSNDKRESQGR